MPIKVLNAKTASKIAAGEVIIDPMAVVKELLENSIDANSTIIDINIENGGKDRILVADNGYGIPYEDVALAFKRHATSKISKLEDLTSLGTLGFRGEALASIGAISKVTMKTQFHLEEIGALVDVVDDNIEIKENSFKTGTTVVIKDLFYNTPARLKHLKKSSELTKEIIGIVQNIALSHPEISFSLYCDGELVLKTPGDNQLINSLYTLYGKDITNNLMKINYNNLPLSITGFIGKPEYVKSTRQYQYVTINKRFIQDNKIKKAIEEAYENTIMINKHPIFFIDINIPFDMLDVNIHPAKTKIRILNESLILLLIKDAIRKNIREKTIVKEITMNKPKLIINDKEMIQEKISITSEIVEKPIEKVNELEPPYELDKEQKNDTNMNKYKSEVGIKELFVNAKIIGQIFNTYIIYEGLDYILMIDQHAAHERIIFEELHHKYKTGEKTLQQVFPYNLQLSPKNYQVLINEKQLFEKLGFEYDEFGNNTICLRSVPILFNIPQDHNLLISILEEIQDKIDKTNSKILIDKIILVACKKAVKGNKKMQSIEIEQLIHQLSLCEYPLSCPHGRPTVMKMTQYEFEKQFKRIQ